MDRSKLRISKACQECRARKIRCDGGEPCQRCQFREVPCEYRKKARNRMKKSDRLGIPGQGSGTGAGPAPGQGGPDIPSVSATLAPASSAAIAHHLLAHQLPHPQHRRLPHLGDPTPASSSFSPGTASTASNSGRSGLHNPSVAATHRASSSVFIQLYYGPSSNFSLLNAIYHTIEGTQPGQRRRRRPRPADAQTKTGRAGSTAASRRGATTDTDGHDRIDTSMDGVGVKFEREVSAMSSGDDQSDGDDDDGDGGENDDYDQDDEEGVDYEDGDNTAHNHNTGNEDCTPKGVEEIGPGLDLFNNRRLYFGDLVGGSETSFAICGNGSFTDGGSMFIDRGLAERLLDCYLTTFWLILPIWTRACFRERLARLYESTFLLGPNDPDTIIVLLALSLGASTMEEETTAQYLYRMAKRWASGLDEMVNVQMVQISLLMSHFASERARPNASFLHVGTAVRKAVAAGLHKGVLGGSQNSNGSAAAQEAAHQMRITIWSLYFWETWICFSLGRPSSFPESELDVPFPTEEKLLQSVVTLARIMSKIVACIYKRHHDSLLPLWNEANEIRGELRQFAEKQREDFNFGVVDDPNAGELGVCQTIVSTLYHHTLILTFRPFLVFRAKLQQEDSANHPPPPPWLDTACEYCLDAARHTIAFLIRACERNEICKSIRYHAFFIEGASHVLAFDLLQNKSTRQANFPWVQLAIQALGMILPKRKSGVPLPVDIASNLEHMIRSVYPDFRAANMDTHSGGTVSHSIPVHPSHPRQQQQQQQQRQPPQQQQNGQQYTPASQKAHAPYQHPQQVPQPQTQQSQVHKQQQQQGQRQQISSMDRRPTSLLDSLAAAAGFSGGEGAVGGTNGSNGSNGSKGITNGNGNGMHSSPSSSVPVPQAPSSLPLPIAPLHNQPNNSPSLLSGLNGPGDLNSFSGLSNSLPPLLFPFTPFGGLDEAVGSPSQTPHMGTTNSSQGGGGSGDAPADLTAADLGWNFDFGSMNMEAFLSIDPSMQDFIYRS